MSYEPGKTVTGTQDLTINDSSQDSGKDPKTENPTTLKLQGRFLFTPTAFAGLQLQSDSAPNKKGSKYGIEAAYILKSVQLGTLLSIDAAKNTKDDSEDNADNKSTEINFSADFKSDSNQTFSVGSTYENSTSANHTSSSDSTTKGSRIGFNAGGYIRF
ncbi:MAG: hypothetical protein NTV34_02775 [Proteobacteria bacterium]|nr:hypothetical protein [Pseudomonadota bacterium]